MILRAIFAVILAVYVGVYLKVGLGHVRHGMGLFPRHVVISRAES